MISNLPNYGRESSTVRLSVFPAARQEAYCAPEEGYWMSDKPLVQQALATELADILLKIPDPSSSLLFLKGFWQTMVREWLGIDRLRWGDRNLELSLHSCLTYRMQDGQVLHVDSAFR